MEKLVLKNGDYIKCFNETDYFEKGEQINADCENIFSTDEADNDDYDTTKAIDFVELTNRNFMCEPDAQIYIMYGKNGNPLCLEISCRYENSNAFIEELLYTKHDERFLGYAKTLLSEVAKNIKTKLSAEEMYAFIEEKNDPSIEFHEEFAKANGIDKIAEKIDDDRYRYDFDLSKLKKSTTGFKPEQKEEQTM